MPIKLALPLGGAIAAAWGFLIYQAWQMTHLAMAEMWMPPSRLSQWLMGDFAWVFCMWAVMMAAMMLPSILPMLSAFSRYCQRDTSTSPWLGLWFSGGYLAVWIAFSVMLTALQWLFHGLQWLSPMMENRQPYLAAAILLMAGLYQFTPYKNACLHHCRTPLGFLLHAWRPGVLGAFRMGVQHGATCLGCCWAQMLIMFAVGVMNLTGMLLITLLVFLEKWPPIDSKKLSMLSGTLFLVWGGVWLF
ncbi:MAG: DUF2182 domain-containing protein [Methylomonas sp.]|jgi:predicted metal-binding membrane protein|uniref:DUF2182 domain-containing protein n=1 Tax=Methylomonas sp. TaxID=418 RepID=UPI0025DBA44E|nr:DUF2182 domain-containing protein [Methylomonas sp.]MCK9608738.1 DUF2182 domain-containing protein [Methylomonas sp.]